MRATAPNPTNAQDLVGRWRQVLQELCPVGTFSSDSKAWPSSEELSQLGISETIQLQAWSNVLRLPLLLDLNGRTVIPDFVDRVPISFARRHQIVVLTPIDGQIASAAIGSVQSWSMIDTISRFLRRKLVPYLAPGHEILNVLNFAYSQQEQRSENSVHDLEQKDQETDSSYARLDLLDTADHAPVIKLVNSILFDAIRARASDVHLQPYEQQLTIRQRIDGVLFDALRVPKEYQEEVISRIKVLGRMNIAEKRLPQDGRASVQVGDRLIDLRIASLPTSFGERLVVRFLDKGSRLYTLEELGMSPATLQEFRQLIGLEHGLLLVTGPTGSGKSTTLYAAVREINSKDLNVLTLEDPIEYRLEGVSQTQVNTKKGLTFASGLRNVLRQDPDVIMVGEIRDEETATMAIQSALTGHLVFSTLHTNDAASAVTRLLDLGIEPFLAASSLAGVVAQRLVRRVCQHCCTRVECAGNEMSNAAAKLMLGKDIQLHRGYGCEHCRQTGYHGRIGIFELLRNERPTPAIGPTTIKRR
jgi:general secretion pathway protein E